MKTYFFTGLIAILPIVMTIIVVNFLISLLTSPFLTFTEELPFPLNQILILLILATLTLCIGYLAEWLLLDPLFARLDRLMHKIPLANKIYKGAKELAYHLLAQEKKAFTQTVQVPYFNAHALALLAQENLPINGQPFSSVYVLGSPNPMMGFVLLFPKDKITPLPLSVEEITRLTVSCGLAKTP